MSSAALHWPGGHSTDHSAESPEGLATVEAGPQMCPPQRQPMEIQNSEVKKWKPNRKTEVTKCMKSLR